MAKEQIKLRDLKATAKNQTREALNPEALADYKAHVKRAVDKGADPDFGVLTAYRDPIGGEIYLADGFHRRQALLAYDIAEYWVDVRDSEDAKRDALKHGFKANLEHGVRLTNADKMHNLLLACEDPEWSQMSDNQLADMLGVSQSFVSRNRPAAKKPNEVKSKKGTKVNTSNIGKKGGSSRKKKSEAKKAAKANGKKKATEGETEAPKVDTALRSALAKISKAIDGNGFVGAQIVTAIEDGTIPLSTPDVKKLAQTTEARIQQLAPLVFTHRWSVAKSIKFIDKEPDGETKAAHFINLAISHGGLVRERVESAVFICLIADKYTVGENKDGVITITPNKKKK